MVFCAQCALPTSRLWQTVPRPLAKERPGAPATFPKLQYPSRYSHQVENVPAPPQKASVGGFDGKDKIDVGGKKMDLEAKTDNLLAEWISKEKTGSNAPEISDLDGQQARDGNGMMAGNPGASQQTSQAVSGITQTGK
ncbi:MAG: hypothetical protein Q9168_001833 [Polycauliona sp. 1 TL-2023]